MTADPTVLDRIFDRLVRALSGGSPDQLSATFTVSEIVHALVPYRTYRGELGVDTLQDYEHAVLELLAGERGLLVCDPDTVAAIRKELATPDPDTHLLRRLETVSVRLGAVRMPVPQKAPKPPREPGQLISVTREMPTVSADAVVSDAVAIGDAIAREDDELALAAAAAREDDALAQPAEAAREDDELAQPAEAARGDDELAQPAEAAHGDDELAQPAAADLDDAHASVPPLPSVADLATTMPAPPFGPLTTPRQAVHGVTIATPETLSRIAPLSPASVYGDPIQFRGVRHAPADVGGVIFLFGMVARELGFMVEAISSGFPRCEAMRQLAPGKWTRLRIEFELKSRDFRDAGRNPAACDLLVCWDDTWPDRPASLDVLSLAQILPTLASRE